MRRSCCFSWKGISGRSVRSGAVRRLETRFSGDPRHDGPGTIYVEASRLQWGGAVPRDPRVKLVVAGEGWGLEKSLDFKALELIAPAS